jgi:LuxR family transcriptional regulator, maltose regulon positive regulatory protein
MVEAPSVTPERDALLATKLHVPASRPGQVLRPRLTARLDEGLARGLVLACAPAGYGKTVLLADWARRGECPVAWLSLDAGDNDPARFWRHAVAALDQARPGIGERVAPLLGLPAPSSFQGLVTALINDLAGEQALLLLDDYHLIGSQQVHESLAFLLEHRPAGLRVGLASRSDPPLPLPRLRARGQLTEIRQAELRFTSAEAWELLQQAASGLPEASAAALAARTEGWAAGLQLAALSLRGHHDAVAFVAAFTGSHRYILDYLAEEVLEQQDAQLRTFLLETSVLERLSGPLCDAVTGREGSQALLEAAERAGLFLIPLDEVRGWWRYHHLFADLLQARLRQGQPGKPRGLHRAAAAWCDAQGLADETIRYALAAGDAAWAARLIERHYDAIFLRGESATIQGWISALPAELAQSRPRLLLAQAWMALVGGDVEAAGAPLDAAERAFGGAANEPFEPSVGRAASLLANVPAAIALARAYLAVLHGDAEGMAASASPALPALDEEEWVLHSASLWILAIAEWVRGRLEDAERGFAASVARWRAAGQRPLAAWACLDLGRVQRSRGRLDASLTTYEQLVEDTAPPGRAAMPSAGIGYVGMAEVAYQRGELDTALQHVTKGIELSRQLNWKTQPLAAGLVTLAWIRQANGDPSGAQEAIAEAERVAPSPSLANLFNPVPAQRARLLLAQGDIAGAARWAEEGDLRIDDEPVYQKEREHLVLARVLLTQDQPATALALLDRLHAAAAAQDRVGSLIEIGALRALALAAAGEENAAVDALAEALTLACPQGYVRVFADEGAPMAALLARLIAAQRSGGAVAEVPLGCLARLHHALRAPDIVPDAGRGSVTAVPGLVDPLTGRELEVLQMLAAGRSNRAIASQLVVSLDTVKKHVSHVLGKLGAANRTEAVARARELSLIP